MKGYFHSVRLVSDNCKGCVNCIKRCPTEAIRIRGGKAQIIEARCIDCGECIRHCPNQAKTAYSDDLTELSKYRYNIALPAPSLYGQFPLEFDTNKILEAFVGLGFQEVFEVAQGADIITLAMRDYLQRQDIKRPAISSACPAVVRLIQIRFPELIEHLVSLDAPMEMAARMIRKKKCMDLGLPDEKIGVFFISPCPAKVTAVKQPLGTGKTQLSGAIGISRIYHSLLKNALALEDNFSIYAKASCLGLSWGIAGGETSALEIRNHLVVDGIHNVIAVLEQVSMGKLRDVDYLECQACGGGCVGGPLMIENRFVARNRMRKRIEQLKLAGKENFKHSQYLYKQGKYLPEETLIIEPSPILRLDQDIYKAMVKVEQMENTLKNLPGLDCGSCGSPNCKALAEDIAQGIAAETDCVFKLRERVRDLAEEMYEVAKRLPPTVHARNERGEE